MSQNLSPRVNLARIGQAKPNELAIRFAAGGAITAGAGLIAHTFGPVVGGLFLAFPSVLPASVTLLEKHFGKEVAGTDALGATLGSAGLIAFALVLWLLADRLSPILVLGLALAAWTLASGGLWLLARSHLRGDDREAEWETQEHERPFGKTK